tara:strand:+ start:845 stop:1180 length:336 start_codon:yes stop_codon:yes gene_type:complete
MASKSRYKIKQYSRDKIDELNGLLDTDAYSIKISTDPSKKLDVFLYDKKIDSVGAIKKNGVPYLDFPSYTETMGQEYADRRRILYYQRHAKEPTIKDGAVTTSWWSKYLLW